MLFQRLPVLHALGDDLGVQLLVPLLPLVQGDVELGLTNFRNHRLLRLNGFLRRLLLRFLFYFLLLFRLFLSLLRFLRLFRFLGLLHDDSLVHWLCYPLLAVSVEPVLFVFVVLEVPLLFIHVVAVDDDSHDPFLAQSLFTDQLRLAWFTLYADLRVSASDAVVVDLQARFLLHWRLLFRRCFVLLRFSGLLLGLSSLFTFRGLLWDFLVLFWWRVFSFG